jgi:ABC-type Fe3+/spermidine/putrescine transport system ATPase subunit
VGITTILVTHDQDEALAMADRVAVMRDGRLEQIGRPEELYNNPRTAFVAGFVGRVNSFAATAAAGGAAGELRAELAGGGALSLPRDGTAPPPGTPLTILARAEAIAIVPEAEGHLPAVVLDSHFMGSVREVLLKTGPGDRVRLSCPAGTAVPAPGHACGLRLTPPGVFAFPA